MYYYGNGYGAGAPVGGGYQQYGGTAYPVTGNNGSIWAIILVLFLLFVIIGCGDCGSRNWGCC